MYCNAWTPLNKEMTDTLFRENSVLLGRIDYITEQKARELTCAEALEFAKRMTKPGCGYNGYGNGNATICGLTLEGFRLAVTWMNIESLK